MVMPAIQVRQSYDALARKWARPDQAAFLDAFGDLDDEEDRLEALRLRFRFDVAWFCRYCWPERFDLPFNPCHDALLGKETAHYLDRPTRKDAIAAPRGLGKSTVSSFAVPLHRIVYGLERFIMILSAEQSLADDLVSDIKVALEDKESELWALYGPFEIRGGKTDFHVKVGEHKTIRVLAKSFGTQVRGKKHDGERPTLIIVDDGERSDRVRSPEQRRHWWKFLHDDILKAGRKSGGTETHVRGTVLHPDSMLANLLAANGWSSERYASIISWPERPELWERCRKIWCNLTLGNQDIRTAAARAFYEANRAEMDLGVVLLDPVAEPIFDLYLTIWGEGLSSFLREKQNEPRDAGSAFFDSAKFARFRVVGDELITNDGRRVRLSDLTVVLRLDPIPGKELGVMGEEAGSGQGDYAAIAAIGRDRFGYCYVLDIWMRRCRDVDMINALFTLAQRWGAKRASIESNGFQRLIVRNFKRMQGERREAGLFYQVGVVEDDSSVSKEDRIASLEPATANGWLLFNDAISVPAIAQFDEFPSGSHDDAPDAVEGAFRLLGQTTVRLVNRPFGGPAARR